MNAIVEQRGTGVSFPGVLNPQTFDQLVTFADLAAASGLVPRDYAGKPGAIMIAVQMGSELGLSPMQSIQSIAVINGRPGVWGDGLIGLCRASPLCQDIIETMEGEGDERVATCTAIRRGATPITHRFSVADAKRAGLWQTEEKVRRRGKDGGFYEAVNDSPWFRYPERMLQNRARGFTLRDAFPDVLRGLKTVEELIDTPPDTFRGTTLDAAAEPPMQRRAQPAQQSAQPAQPGPPKRTWRMLIDEVQTMLLNCDTVEKVVAVADIPAVRDALEKGPQKVQIEISDLLAVAYSRVPPTPHPEAAEGGDALDEVLA